MKKSKYLIIAATFAAASAFTGCNDEKKEVLYNRKSRLKSRIRSSNAPHKEAFLSALK